MKYRKLILLSVLVLLAATPLVVLLRKDASIPADADADQKGIALPILMYHHIIKNPAKQNKYAISPEEFEADIKYIKEQGYTSVTIRDLVDFCEKKTPLPEKPIMITFDDGHDSFRVYALPVLEKYETKAVFSVVGEFAEEYSKEGVPADVSYAYSNWEQLATLSRSPYVELANHTFYMHKTSGRNGCAMVAGESVSQYEQVLTEDLNLLEQNFASKLDGYQSLCFTYPFGAKSEQTLPIVQKLGFKATLGCYERLNYLTGDPKELYDLRRYNRPHNVNIADFLAKMK
ncbi:MAG: polysaccharide deacetylase [Ruminococcaceae bacterium]|nr:polysaccharide deacetylase [Oscillospiraceae bacterium]